MRLLLILSFIQSQRSRIIVNGWLIVFSLQVCPMKQLSDGQRCRVSFAWLAWQQPHLLLLDGEILFRYPKQQNKSDQF
jgi:ATPase subunit of ABC transporter with duplicated ATPase domains